MEEKLDLSARRLLRELGLRPSKGLGQNFLVDRSVPPQILEAANLSSEDSVVEIGPGVGVLTLPMARLVQQLTAVELDRRLYPYLQAALAPFPGAKLVEGDALEFDPADLAPMPYKLVANIPYYITSAILRHFLESDHRPSRLVLMVQKEVAQRIVAQPPDMSLLAVSVQFYGQPKIWATVSASAFFPLPKVDSAILLIETFAPQYDQSSDLPKRPCPDVESARFFEIVRAGFSQKRKQLVNSLASGLHQDKALIQQALEKAGLESTRRAESLSLIEWSQLYPHLT
ncbi:MAG: 16S rRNA (adenine(1518)-N(6)/adenine(1519)-N(6))-dimethyltransferase RsmA [Chloroflexota bacterium]